MARFESAGARALTDVEQSVKRAVPLQVDLGRVRLYEGGCGGAAGWLRALVLGTSRNRAVALGNHVFLPDRCQGDLAVLAHELTHCAQYQAWGPVVYFARGMATQLGELLHRKLGVVSSPYHYQMRKGKPFEAYGMEQQAQMVEDSVRRPGTDHVMPSA
jgi:hypothetical protein